MGSKVKYGRRLPGFNMIVHLKENSVYVPKTGCLEWTGGTDANGYGKTWFMGRSRPVSRVAAHIYGILDIHSTLNVCHKCDNPPCFAREHLFPGDDSRNLIDAVEKGRHPNSVKKQCKNGHVLAGTNVRVEKRNSGRPRRTCIECRRARGRKYDALRRPRKRA